VDVAQAECCGGAGLVFAFVLGVVQENYQVYVVKRYL
jgi:hypothetical protein